MRRRPTVMFESWRGRYADSPRAISERLAERHPQLRQIWVAAETTELPGDVMRVRRHTPEYFARLATTDFLVANDIVSKHIVKGPRLTYLQTWHGTPLKAIGHDERTPQYDAAAHLRRMDRDVRKWDVLLSPSAECTEIFRRAFRFEGRVIETGYPRNDVLRSPRAHEIAQRTRRRLSIDSAAKVVLYAPTWRDDLRDSAGAGFADPGALDPAELLRLGSEDTVLLVRMHSVVTTRLGAAAGERVIDVSDYPDISELYLAADVLVSDYSSAVFDFAVTGKPIVLFPYDLDHYRSGVRDLYFDYEDWAPGPIVATTAELAAAIEDVTSAAPELTRTDAYCRFVARFCPHEDGGASDRVIEAVFEPLLS